MEGKENHAGEEGGAYRRDTPRLNAQGKPRMKSWEKKMPGIAFRVVGVVDKLAGRMPALRGIACRVENGWGASGLLILAARGYRLGCAEYAWPPFPSSGQALKVAAT